VGHLDLVATVTLSIIGHCQFDSHCLLALPRMRAHKTAGDRAAACIPSRKHRASSSKMHRVCLPLSDDSPSVRAYFGIKCIHLRKTRLRAMLRGSARSENAHRWLCRLRDGA